MLNQKLWDGVNILLDNYAHVEKEDVVVIVYAPDSIEATGWISTALEQRGISAKLVRTKPLTDNEFSAKLESILPKVNSLKGKLVIITLERDTMSNTTELREAMKQYPDDKCIIVRAMSEAYGFFNYGIQADPQELSARNTTILERCMGAKHLHLTSESGSDLHIELSKEHRWISNRGIFRPGNFLILPAGEVATYPGKISGTLVANFALHINMITKIDTRLNECPVTIEIKDNKVISYHCDNPDIYEIIDKSFNKENAKNVGELGFGTNYGVDIAVPENSHVNERRPGIHLGFGQHNQGGIIDYHCDVHMDLIAKGGLVWIDDDPEPIDMENIKPSVNAHPERLYDEDVFAPGTKADSDDCCGVICPTK
ncbi:aminopeptidase [Pseudoalteromonas denitrificans]|jgi:leucyl aminopeptidase (aminopeptidase T)|uniref:Thermophilic metalloprotease (M29) n=1 Tax=Pseudoalteromonas denitrificans DSM 6059 TaxID=1123010 RepID=A0A1I1JJ73_9GAMM|nr:aminopeptidase [Pseudoalteromonas denitrificans]SFC48604.1 Thermophilic metalloprotease (M29) [Pseudoalteromonas denitrificans DSM 6059]